MAAAPWVVGADPLAPLDIAIATATRTAAVIPTPPNIRNRRPRRARSLRACSCASRRSRACSLRFLREAISAAERRPPWRRAPLSGGLASFSGGRRAGPSGSALTPGRPDRRSLGETRIPPTALERDARGRRESAESLRAETPGALRILLETSQSPLVAVIQDQLCDVDRALDPSEADPRWLGRLPQRWP